MFNGTHRQQAIKNLLDTGKMPDNTLTQGIVININVMKSRFESGENPNNLIEEVVDFVKDMPSSCEWVFIKARLRRLLKLPDVPRTAIYNLGDVRILYPQIAKIEKDYAKLYERYMGRKCGRAHEVAMAIYFGEPSDKTVAELGGRNSFLASYISDIVDSVVVLDNFKGWENFGDESIWFNKWQIAAKNLSRLKCQKQEITKMSFNDNSFDLVIALSVIEHSFAYPDSDIDCAIEIARVLKPGGMLIMSTDFAKEYNPNPHFRHYTEEMFLERIVGPSGLIIDSDRDFRVRGYDTRGWDSAMVFLTKPER